MKHEQTWTGERIPPERWHRDHWSTLAFIGHHEGDFLNRDRMRCKPGSVMIGPIMAPIMAARQKESEEFLGYPTRLQDATLYNHDDYDCADDIEACGLWRNIGTGHSPRYKLSHEGFKIWRYICRTRRSTGEMDSLTLDEIEKATGIRIATKQEDK